MFANFMNRKISIEALSFVKIMVSDCHVENDHVEKVSAGGDYWEQKNSFGYNWGDGGYFRLHRGNGTCRIDADVLGPRMYGL